jgi:dihydroorotate dehydrogenase
MSNIRRFLWRDRFFYLGVGSGSYLAYKIPSTSSLYKDYGQHIRSLIEPEMAHRLTVNILSYNRYVRAILGLVPHENDENDESLLKTRVFDMNFPNPVGMAAGFDKNGECIQGVLDMGFGFTEIGSVTHFRLTGNPKPRVFRNEEEKTIINKYGMNNDGCGMVGWRMSSYRYHDKGRGIVGVNVGDDDLYTFWSLSTHADYVVINISCPNVEKRRNQNLQKLVTDIKSKSTTPLLIKIAPDITPGYVDEITSLTGIDGIIVSNTKNGLSGPPLREVSTNLIREIYQKTNGKIPIVGVGGVSTGRDAYEKIRNGASLVQLYTSFVYEGPMVVHDIKKELAELLRKDGFKSVSDAVGVDARMDSG